MMAAIEAGKRGRRVLIFDHAQAPGEKIRISGGGRCNFTNRETQPERFISGNPRFSISALKRYTAQDFIALVDRYSIAWHEKALGQLFCDGSSRQVINLLTTEMQKAGVTLELGTVLEQVEKAGTGFQVALSTGPLTCASLVVASGGKSIPKMGASGLGYKLAAEFGLRVTATRPALVPLTFEPRMLEKLAPLAGVSADVVATAGGMSFREALLFTHRGLSGPAILQISSYWREGESISIDFAPHFDVADALRRARKETPRLALQTVLAQHLPKRLAQMLSDDIGLAGQVGDFSDAKCTQVETALKHWAVKPTGTEGYR